MKWQRIKVVGSSLEKDGFKIWTQVSDSKAQEFKKYIKV